jgi:predicted DCC family thiol-disulfide oxidoreductase YuxK
VAEGNKPDLTVFYNTLCPVCDAGISWQRTRLLALVKAGQLDFKDINLEPEALAAFGVSLDDIRRRLHALDAEGRLVTGADVVFALWRMTPGLRWLAMVLGNAVILPLSRFVYDRCADVLFAWNRRRGHW